MRVNKINLLTVVAVAMCKFSMGSMLQCVNVIIKTMSVRYCAWKCIGCRIVVQDLSFDILLFSSTNLTYKLATCPAAASTDAMQQLFRLAIALFVTASHSLLSDVTSRLTAFSLLLTPQGDPAANAP